MGAWQQTRLGEVSEIYSGFAFRSEDLGENGIPVVKIANIQNKRVRPDSADHFPDELWTEKLNRYLLQPDDTLIAMTGAGSVGRVGKMARVNGRFLVNQRVAIVRPAKSRCDPAFVYFALSQDYYETKLYALGLGAGQPNVSSKQIGELEIPFPPLAVQQRIAGILTTYDELMENCRRRIRILEEMARALYREWFVHFRFPGHEKVPRLDSPLGPIPKGWEAKRLDSVCDSIHDGDWIETKDQGGSDHRLLQISNIGVGEFIETGNYRYITQETFDRLRCNEIMPGDILVARMPTPIGRAWLATKMPWRMITAVDVAIIRTRRDALDPLFLAYAWNEASNLQRILTQASGTTRLRVTRRELSALEFVIPPIEMQSRFAALIEPNARLIETLRSKTENLRRTRDLLLPRLLSGQVSLDVSAVEDVAEPTAPAPPLSQTNLASEEPALRAAEEAPPYRVERVGHGLSPPAEPADEAPVPIDQIDRTEVLQVIRQVFSEGPFRERDAAIRDVARALGYRRTGPRIQEILHTDLMTAVRRCILENQNGALRLCARSITDYDRNFLKQQFLAAIGRAWIDRDTATRDFCRWLGFARTGPIIEGAARSIINGLLREGRLATDGSRLIRKV